MRRKMGSCFIVALACLLATAWAGSALGETGIPVTSDKVLNMCTGCHKNNGGLVSRISYLRQAPEAWEETLWRHKRIHGLSITKEEKESLILYFSEKHGLAPAEVAPYAYTLEKRDTKEKVDSQVIIDMCVRCHSYAKTALQRRTPEDWPKLANMHSGVLPMWLYQLQDVLDWDDTLAACLKELSKRFPLETPEWKQWSAIAPEGGRGEMGRRRVPGRERGVRRRNRAEEDGRRLLLVRRTVEFESGEKQPIEGKATLYGGYAWRASGTLAGKPIREVFHISMDGSTFTGVRFDDPHFELRGVETRAFAGSSPRILSVMPKALKAGTKGATVTVVGTGLSKEVSLGDGVTVKKVVSASPTKVVVTVDVADKAAAGYRNANAGSAAADKLFAVYASVDYIKVVPSPAMSRTGGLGYAVKQLVQFDAMAVSKGADGAPGTADDIEIGRIPGRMECRGARKLQRGPRCGLRREDRQERALHPRGRRPQPEAVHAGKQHGRRLGDGRILRARGRAAVRPRLPARHHPSVRAEAGAVSGPWTPWETSRAGPARERLSFRISVSRRKGRRISTRRNPAGYSGWRTARGMRWPPSARTAWAGRLPGRTGRSSRSRESGHPPTAGEDGARTVRHRASPPAAPYARADVDVLLQPRMPLLLRGPGGRMRFPRAGGRNAGGDVPGVAPGKRPVPARPLRKPPESVHRPLRRGAASPVPPPASRGSRGPRDGDREGEGGLLLPHHQRHPPRRGRSPVS